MRNGGFLSYAVLIVMVVLFVLVFAHHSSQVVSAALLAPSAAGTSVPEPQQYPALELEPKAVEILKATSSKLASAHTLTFTAVETFESISRQGLPLVYGNKFETVLQRPNKLRVLLEGDGPASEFYYDGKIAMAYAPVENLVAITDAPATIDQTLEAVYHSAG